MTIIDKLPLIRGWNWRTEFRITTLLLNEERLVYQPPPPQKEIGWVQFIDIQANDAYMGLRIVMPGVDTGYATFAGAMPLGSVLPEVHSPYLLRYYQPNPLRTYGMYAMMVMAPPSMYPYYGVARLYMSLRPGSTEPYASAATRISQLVIEDRNLFLTDLRKVLYGRWAPLLDFVGHIPLLRTLTKKFEDLGIRFEEKEIIEPPGVAR